MLANENVDGHVLECRDAARFRKDVDTSQRVRGDLMRLARPLFDDSSVSPVLEMREYFGIVLNHLNCLVLGLLEVPVQCCLKEPGDITEQLLVHVKKLFMGPNFDLNDRIKGVPMQKLAIGTVIVTVTQNLTYRLGLYAASACLSDEAGLDVMLLANQMGSSCLGNKIKVLRLVSRFQVALEMKRVVLCDWISNEAINIGEDYILQSQRQVTYRLMASGFNFILLPTVTTQLS